MARKRQVGGIQVKELPSLGELVTECWLDRERWVICAVQRGRNLRFVRSMPMPQGYRRVWLFGQNWVEHRLIWKLYYGTDPVGIIDHINGIRDDNRIENLRDVTPTENAMNMIRDRWASELRQRKGRKVIARRARAERLKEMRFARLCKVAIPHLGCLLSC